MASVSCSIERRAYWQRRDDDLPAHIVSLFTYIDNFKKANAGVAPTAKQMARKFGKVKTTALNWVEELRRYGLIETERLKRRFGRVVLRGALAIELNWDVFNAYMVASQERRRQRQQEAMVRRQKRSFGPALVARIKALSEAVSLRNLREPKIGSVVDHPLEEYSFLRKREQSVIAPSGILQRKVEPDLFDLVNGRMDGRRRREKEA